MNAEEMEGCFRMLRAYWPGEWDQARYAVWAKEFAEMTHERAIKQITQMGRTETFPTVAAFLAAEPTYDRLMRRLQASEVQA